MIDPNVTMLALQRMDEQLLECRAELADARVSAFNWQSGAESLKEALDAARAERDTARAALAELHKHWSEMSEDAGRYFKRVEASEAGLAALQARVARAVADLQELLRHALPTDSHSHAKDLALRALEALK